MFRRKVVVIMVLMFMIGISGTAPADAKGPGTTSGSFLKIGTAARPVALGEAFVGIADDAASVLLNPAGLAYLDRIEFSAMHIEWFQDIKYHSLCYVQPVLNWFTLGLNMSYLHTDGIPRTIIANNYDGYLILDDRWGAWDKLGVLAAGRKLSTQVGAGVSIKYIAESIDDAEADTLSSDIGILAEEPMLGGVWRAGIAVQNIGGSLKFDRMHESIPLIVRLGASGSYFRDGLLLAIEAEQPIDNNLTVKAGAELWLWGRIALRAGYKQRVGGNVLGALSGLTSGCGFRIYNYYIDYAFVPYGDLGYTHRFSFGGKF